MMLASLIKRHSQTRQEPLWKLDAFFVFVRLLGDDERLQMGFSVHRTSRSLIFVDFRTGGGLCDHS
jgi:hypothetical protein